MLWRDRHAQHRQRLSDHRPVFLAIDAVWLTLTANALYRPHLGPILREGSRSPPAAAFYFIYVGGMVFFAVRRACSPARP